jgi:hypothetical protein
MSGKKENTSLKSEARDALAAMKRAAQLARKTAIQTDTAIIMIRDGKCVRVTAEELRKE